MPAHGEALPEGLRPRGTFGHSSTIRRDCASDRLGGLDDDGVCEGHRLFCDCDS
jgi:hypothetical protein